MLKKWEDLPEFMKTEEVRPYWEILNKHRGQIVLKRIFDLIVSLVLLVILVIPMAIIAVWIKLDSKGPVFYRQERVTTYGKHFRIHKFRTMVSNADKIGSAVTVGNDSRITKVGSKLRHLRLDELPQVFDVIAGAMSFVGTRPEAVKYVVYRFNAGETVNLDDEKHILSITSQNFFRLNMPGVYVVTALDRMSNESKGVKVNF